MDKFIENATAGMKRDAEAIKRAEQSRQEFEAKERATQGYKRKNVYLCEDCGGGFVSADLEEGVTPFMTKCVLCGGTASSLFYNVPQQILANLPHRLEWYKPSKREYKKLSLGAQSHVDKGGLISREVPPKKIKRGRG